MCFFYFCHQSNGLSPSQAPGVMLPGKARAPASVPFHMKSQNILCVQPELWGEDWPGRGTDLMEDLGAAPAGSLPLALLPVSLLPARTLTVRSAALLPLFSSPVPFAERGDPTFSTCVPRTPLWAPEAALSCVSFFHRSPAFLFSV